MNEDLMLRWISSKPQTLFEAIEIAMRLDEHYAQTQEEMKQTKSLAVSPPKFEKTII